jgi:hypothetical protein
MRQSSDGWPVYDDYAGREKRWPADRFTVTEDHRKLLRRLNIGYDEWTEGGAPEVDPKRPYGNGDLYGDMREILGRPDAPDGELIELHKQMATVLQILVYTASLEPGEYESPKYFAEWRRNTNGGCNT